jgi:polyphosphate kinase
MPNSFINRELSWLEFNQRVLNEAARDDLPLLERVKFLAITASNLDEFFQVRVGGLSMLQRNGSKKRGQAGMTPDKQLAAIRRRTLRMIEEQYELFRTRLVPALAAEGIVRHLPEDLDSERAGFLDAHFEESILPLLTPLAVPGEDDPAAPPFLPPLQLIVACRLTGGAAPSATRHVLIPLPEGVARRVAIPDPDASYAYVLLEDVIARHAGALFPGEQVEAAACFRVTRNGDIAVQEEDAIDFAGEMEEVLTARKFTETVRLEIPASVPRDLFAMIRRVADCGTGETYRHDGPLALADLMGLSGLPGFDRLRYEEWPPQPSPSIPPGAPVFEAIDRGDVMLAHPYESFEPVLRLIEEAAEDPDTLVIKQVLYRTASHSRVIDALIRAAENGKNVTVLTELKARFDEAQNLRRAADLQRAGANVVYGVKRLKTHAKICLIVRRENGRLRRYVHLGTGNYNEVTARFYTDISYLTCRPEYGRDASLFFNAVTGRSKLLHCQALVPAPTEMKPRLLDLIDAETERARQGEPARILAKMNALQDPDIIRALYRASEAGVKIRLNVRGICCLKPGSRPAARNIEILSVIDRYLEHSRIFYFHCGGDPEVFIASADWMMRNLERRVELMIPIYDPPIRRRLVHILESFFRDNTQASAILPDGTSRRLAPKKPKKAFRVQEFLYREACRAAQAREHERATTFEPHVPPN